MMPMPVSPLRGAQPFDALLAGLGVFRRPVGEGEGLEGAAPEEMRAASLNGLCGGDDQLLGFHHIGTGEHRDQIATKLDAGHFKARLVVRVLLGGQWKLGLQIFRRYVLARRLVLNCHDALLLDCGLANAKPAGAG